MAFARYSFTSRLFCTNQPSFHSPQSSALPTLVQYHCATIGQYTTLFRPPVFTPCTTQYCALQYRVKAKFLRGLTRDAPHSTRKRRDSSHEGQPRLAGPRLAGQVHIALVTAAPSGTHTRAMGGRQLARAPTLARPTTGCGYRRGASEIPMGSP